MKQKSSPYALLCTATLFFYWSCNRQETLLEKEKVQKGFLGIETTTYENPCK